MAKTQVIKYGRPRVDRTGCRYGRLVVIKKITRKKNGVFYWLCRCDCGTERIIAGSNLSGKKSTSCGCYQIDRVKEINITHGMSYTKIYRAWRAMINRCENKNNIGYALYGGRGIKVCKRWHKFENFYKDMGDRPTPKHTLDRIDNNGHYCKKNCRWATQKEQQRNRRNNRHITFRGKTQSLKDWEEDTGIARRTIHARIKYGWSIKDALTTPINEKYHRCPTVACDLLATV